MHNPHVTNKLTLEITTKKKQYDENQLAEFAIFFFNHQFEWVLLKSPKLVSCSTINFNQMKSIQNRQFDFVSNKNGKEILMRSATLTNIYHISVSNYLLPYHIPHTEAKRPVVKPSSDESGL